MGILTAVTDIDSEYLLSGGAITLVAVLLAVSWPTLADEFCYRQFPLVGKNPWEFFNGPARARWARSAEELIIHGCQQVECFYLPLSFFKWPLYRPGLACIMYNVTTNSHKSMAAGLQGVPGDDGNRAHVDSRSKFGRQHQKSSGS
jgi:hypothetical protein